MDEVIEIKAGDYKLRWIPESECPFYLGHKSGEGMGCSESDIAKMLDEFFRENF